MSEDRKINFHPANVIAPEEEVTRAPYGFWRTVIIVLCGHLGVRPAHKRREDFQRANGVHVFAVAVLYFVFVIVGLIVLVNYVVG